MALYLIKSVMYPHGKTTTSLRGGNNKIAEAEM